LYDVEVRDGMAGVCDHATISRVYKKSTHTDVGPNFPWDVLWSDVALLLNPLTPDADPEDDMEPPYVIVPKGSWAPWWYPHLYVGTADRKATVTVSGEVDASVPRLECTDRGQYTRKCDQSNVQLLVEVPA
jgi:hypothetical protein